MLKTGKIKIAVLFVVFVAVALPIREQEYTVFEPERGASVLEVRTQSLASIILGLPVGTAATVAAAVTAVVCAAVCKRLSR